jgi:hypothetical protein
MFPRRQPHGRGHRQRRAAASLAALAAAVALTAPWPGAAAHASDSTPRLHAYSPSHRGWVKYYIVQPPTDQHSEDLYEIAAKALGNGRLAATIFRLNQGRLQPDGGRLQDPEVIRPGWVLVLPATASGPGVRFGPRPAVTGAPTASPPPGRARVAGSPTAAGQPRHQIAEHAAVVAGVILVALLLAAGLVLAGRRRRKARVTRSPHSGHALAPPAPLAPGLPPGASPPSPPRALTARFPALGIPGQPAGLLARPAPAAIDGPARPPSPGRVLPAAPRPDGPGQPDRGDPGMAAQDHEVAFADDRVHVVLAGVPAGARDGRPRNGSAGRRPAPYLVWTSRPGDTPDGGVAFACLGTGAAGALFVDIDAAPGAVAIGGDDAAAVRLAESIAHQLCAAPAAGRRYLVVVIGDTLPAPPPAAAAWVASLQELAGPARQPAGSGDRTEVVFCRSTPKEDMLWLAGYVSRARHRVVPVVLASTPDAPWSFTAQPSRHPDESPHSVIA